MLLNKSIKEISILRHLMLLERMKHHLFIRVLIAQILRGNIKSLKNRQKKSYKAHHDLNLDKVAPMSGMDAQIILKHHQE